jgi:hypothetical protein
VSFEVVHGTWANSVNKNTITSVLGHCVDFTNIQNTFGEKKHEMRLGFHNYALIMHTEKSCIKCGNKLNCLQRYDIAQNYRIILGVVQRLCQSQNILHHHWIWKFCQIR